MTHHTAQHPNLFYLDGLRQAAPNAVESLYSEFRNPVVRAVEAAGGSRADGYTFFRVAAIHAGMLAQTGGISEETPIFYFLKNLAIAHFSDWATEKAVELPELPAPADDEAEFSIVLPDPEARLEIRQFIRAKRQFTRLEPTCRKLVNEQAITASLNLPDPSLDHDPATQECIRKYRQALGETEQELSATLPAWSVEAITNEHFNRLWSAAESLEGRLSMGQTAAPEPKSNLTRNVLIALAVLFVGLGALSYFTRSRSPQEVYDSNFKPPTSIMADRASRVSPDSLASEQAAICEHLFAEADEFYKNKQWNEAADVLSTMISDDTEDCKSDALFYLGIIGLQVGQPEISIDCFAKIPDIDRFGEDLYWYQALAFVKIAATNPARRDIARRAVERARSNTEIPERRAQAEKMLEELKK